MAKTSRLKKTVLLVIKIGLAVGLLTWLVLSGKLHLDKIGAAIRDRPLWMILAFVIYNSCIVLTAIRWRTRPSDGVCCCRHRTSIRRAPTACE